MPSLTRPRRTRKLSGVALGLGLVVTMGIGNDALTRHVFSAPCIARGGTPVFIDSGLFGFRMSFRCAGPASSNYRGDPS